MSFNRPFVETVEEGAQDPLMPNATGGSTPQSQAVANSAVSMSLAAQSDQGQAQDVCDSYGASFDHVFSGADAFLARMTDAQAQAMITDPRISIVEPDQAVDLPTWQPLSDATDTTDPDLVQWQWGLDAIDQRGGARDYRFNYTNTGYNATSGFSANVFVVGVGIWSGHPDLGGRVTLDQNLVDPTRPALDASDNGHDTMVATVIGGDTCGVAKQAKIHAVKVGVSSSNASLSKVIDGMAWVLSNYKSYVGPSVVHCSFLANKQLKIPYTGPTYPTKKDNTVATCLERIVNSLLKVGVPVVVPAGNSNQEAKNWAPASVDSAITVGGVYQNKNILAYSNYGSKVDLFAPGYNLRVGCFRISGDVYSGTYTPIYLHCEGTSLAAPFVTGAVANYLQTHPKAKIKDVSNWIKSNASGNLQGDLHSSPNKFLYLAPGGY